MYMKNFKPDEEMKGVNVKHNGFTNVSQEKAFSYQETIY